MSLQPGCLVRGVVKSKYTNGVCMNVKDIQCDLHYHAMRNKVLIFHFFFLLYSLMIILKWK